MTVSSPTNRVSFAGNGSTVAFAYPYYYLDKGDLVVILKTDSTGVETVQTITTNYTVSPDGPVEAGGTVTMTTAPASGQTLIIYRDPALTQDADYEDNDAFPAATHERALDRSRMIDIRLNELIAQAPKVPEGEGSTARLPALVDRAGNYAWFDANGNLSYATAAAVTVATGDVLFETRTAVTLASIDSAINAIQVSGYGSAGDGGAALYARVGSEPSHNGKVQSADGAWWELVPLPWGIHVEAFGVVGDGSSDNASAMANAISYCIAKGVGTLRFGDGVFEFDTQVAITAGAGSPLRLNIIGNGIVNTTINLNVTGSVSGYDTAGFGWLFDGWRDSRLDGMRINFDSGTAGLCFRCRNEYVVNNSLGPNLEVRGGNAVTARETATKIAIQYTGNESAGSSTAYTTYYNQIVGARLTTAYNLVKHVVGDGPAQTQQPNANDLHLCRLDRYIIAVDWDDTDENTATACWFNNAAGVTGINGGYTHCFDTDGSLNRITGTGMEPGTNSKPWRFGSTAASNMVTIANNCTDLGDYNATSQDNHIVDRDRVRGISRVNDIASDTDDDGSVHFFGDGSNAHDGTGFFRVYIWARDGNTDRIALGYTATNTAEIEVPAGDLLLIDADNLTADASVFKLTGLPTYADDSAAGAGGLTSGAVYKTAAGALRIKL